MLPVYVEYYGYNQTLIPYNQALILCYVELGRFSKSKYIKGLLKSYIYFDMQYLKSVGFLRKVIVLI